MPQIFHPSLNTLSRVSIFGGLFFLVMAIAIAFVVVRSPYVTGAGVVREQPVPFSHKHHVADAGIDCRYCHTGVEESAFAGIPPTKTCMNCHSQLFNDSPMLEPVRDSLRTNQPLRWTRVHDLPGYAYFDHSIHVHKGIGCTTCHGHVDQMPLMWRAESLLMEWCLDCHRYPSDHIRPRSAVFQVDWDDRELSEDERRSLADEYGVPSKTSCSVCHR
jgi:hypothetical protein